MAFKPEEIRPTEIQEKEGKGLLVFWKDGHESAFQFPYLRRNCRCAGCIDELTGVLRLRPESVSEKISPKNIQPVGNYGIRFEWSDGHSTGIYAFEYLRAICPCQACVTLRQAR